MDLTCIFYLPELIQKTQFARTDPVLYKLRHIFLAVMFSATFPRQMEALARRILNRPIEVQVGGRSVVCKDIEQTVSIVDEEGKFLKLLEVLGSLLGYHSYIT